MFRELISALDIRQFWLQKMLRSHGSIVILHLWAVECFHYNVGGQFLHVESILATLQDPSQPWIRGKVAIMLACSILRFGCAIVLVWYRNKDRKAKKASWAFKSRKMASRWGGERFLHDAGECRRQIYLLVCEVGNYFILYDYLMRKGEWSVQTSSIPERCY